MPENPEDQIDPTPDTAESEDWAPKDIDDDQTHNGSSEETFRRLAAEEPPLPESDFVGETGIMPAITEEGEDPVLKYSNETEPTREIILDPAGARQYAESIRQIPYPMRKSPETTTEPDHSPDATTLPISVDEASIHDVDMPEKPPQNVMDMVNKNIEHQLSNEDTRQG